MSLESKYALELAINEDVLHSLNDIYDDHFTAEVTFQENTVTVTTNVKHGTCCLGCNVRQDFLQSSENYFLRGDTQEAINSNQNCKLWRISVELEHNTSAEM